MYTFRPATDDDQAFVYELQKRTMRAYIEQTFGPWNDDWQRDYFARHWSPDDTRIILIDGEPVGRVEVRERDEDVYLANINILPERQGDGLGTCIIRDLIDTASPSPLALRVLRTNRDARRLYERLGFVRTHDTDTHYYYRYTPRPAPMARPRGAVRNPSKHR